MSIDSHPTTGNSHREQATATGAQFVEYEAFIEQQLRKTRSQVRGVDVSAAVMLLVAGSVAYFFAAAIIDHWVVSGGLDFWGRFLFLAVYLAAASWWVGTEIVPLLVRRINPLYAAQTIERSRPTLKNALLNFLLFRSNPTAVHQRVFEGIEQQAAASLVGVEVDSAVDRSRLVRLGYVLVALVALCAIYAIVSPKNLFQTVGRVVMPWADIRPPTSTLIDEIEPGSTQAFRGQQVTVKARVQGLPDDEQVRLFYSTADRQIVDRAVEMTLPPDDYRHVVVLPVGDSALQQSLTYRIEAGDARTPDYLIEVVAAPTIVVRAVDYKYPAYTGLLPQRVERQGDLKAIEGTEVTLEAEANQPIEKAYVDFEANRSPDVTLRGNGTTARGTFTLGLTEDRKKPEHELYQLIFKNAAGQENLQPVRHRIEVTADLAPDIQFVQPSREEIDVPLSGSAELEIVATDPDFALSGIRLLIQHGERSLVDEALLNEEWRGQCVRRWRFVPSQYRLAAGDIVEYQAVAEDNKTPRPNRTETSRRRIRITAPTEFDQGDSLPRHDSRGESGDSGQSQAPGDERQQGETRSDDPAQHGTDASDTTNSPEDAAQQPAGRSKAPRQGTDQQPADEARPETSPSVADRSNEKRQTDAEQQPESGDERSQEESSHEKGSPSDASASDQRDQQNSDSSSAGKKSPGDGSQGESSDQQQGDDQQATGDQRGEPGAEPQESVASDGTNDGDAIERILKHREQQDPSADKQGEQSDSQPQQKQQQDGNQQGKQSQQGQQESGQQRSGQHQAGQGDKRQAAEQRPAAKPNDRGNQQSNQGNGEQKSDNRAQGKQQREPQSPDDAAKGKQQSGSSQGGSKSTQTPPSGQSSDGQSSDGQQSPSEQKGSAGKQPNEQTGQGKSTSGGKSEPSEQGDPQSENDQASDQPGASDANQRSGKPSSKSQSPGPGQPERNAGEGQQGTENAPNEKSQPGSQDQRSQGATRDNNTREDGTPQSTNTQGQGAQSKDDPTRSPEQKSEQSGEQRPDARGGDGEQEKGTSGAGQKSEDNAGSPRPQESNQPRDKSQQTSGESSEQKPEGDQQSPSTSKRESDSSSDEDGDRSGGGERGGGQKANQSGTGGAGQNTAADEGAGQSDEAGDGDTGDRAGGDRESQDKTGQQGNQPGKGSQSKRGQGQPQPGGDGSTADPTEAPPQSQNPDQQGGGAAGGDQPGAKQPSGQSATSEQTWQPGVDRAADANLDYTRKATDLALEHLKDQLADGQDDSELLKDLGWTREEADAFIQRWEAMRREAGRPGAAGETSRRELDNTLRSLGLRPRGTALSGGNRPDDRAAGLQESRRTTPPAEYSEAFKAYTQGTARGGK